MSELVEALIRKLRFIGELGREEEAAVRDIPLHLAQLAKGDDTASDGEVVDQSCLLIEGYMHRYKDLPNGNRQIISFHVAGDIPDLQSLHLKRMDHSLAATSASTVAFLKHTDLTAALRRAPRLTDLFWRDTLIDAASYRQMMTILGQAGAASRMAHLFCDLYVRLKTVGKTVDLSFMLPVTQTELAYALGITPVHVNRILQELRRQSLIEFEHGRAVILDWNRLEEQAQFDPTYLHHPYPE